MHVELHIRHSLFAALLLLHSLNSFVPCSSFIPFLYLLVSGWRGGHVAVGIKWMNVYSALDRVTRIVHVFEVESQSDGVS